MSRRRRNGLLELLQRVERTSDGCWLWSGSRYSNGYGKFCFEGRNQQAHRIAYKLLIGAIPQGEGFHGTCVCHSCDVKACINPAHLFLGSHKDNMNDMDRKGRRRVRDSRGERNVRAKLSYADVAEIRTLYDGGQFTQVQLAQQFGVTQVNISSIVRGQTWAA